MFVLVMATWLLLLVLLALAATVPHMPHKGFLRAVAVAWFVVFVAWGASGSTDCWPACTWWHDALDLLMFAIPLAGVLLYLALVIRDHVCRRSSRLPL